MNWIAATVLPVLVSARIIGGSGKPHEYFAGGKIGVVNNFGAHVLPAKFSKIEYLGHGLYQTTSIDLPDQFTFGREHCLYNHDGHRLKLKLPPDCVFEGVFWLGKEAVANPNKRIERIPADALLQVRKGEMLGISDIHGNLIVPTEYADMEKPGYVVALFFKKDRSDAWYRGGASVFNVEDHSLRPVNPDLKFAWSSTFSEDMHVFCGDHGQGYLSRDGSIVIPDRYSEAGPFQNGLAIVAVADPVKPYSWRHFQLDKAAVEHRLEPLIAERLTPDKMAEVKKESMTKWLVRTSAAKTEDCVSLYKCEPDRTIEHTLPPERHFDTVKWKSAIECGIDRTSMMIPFFNDYALTGMPKRQVQDLLGIGGSGCADKNSLYFGLSRYDRRVLKIDFDDSDRVVKFTVQ